MPHRNSVLEIFKNISSKQIKFFLLFVIGISFFSLISVFVSYQSVLEEPKKLIKSLPEGASIVLNKIHHIAKRDGKKELELKALSANYVASKEKLVLQDLETTFYLENGKTAYLTSDRGVLDTKSNDIEVTGNVVLKNENYELFTEKLIYSHEKRILKSVMPVKIVGESSTLTAESMIYDLNTNKLQFEGKVSGAFIGNIKM